MQLLTLRSVFYLLLFSTVLPGCQQNETAPPATLFPSYNTAPVAPDRAGMGRNALQLSTAISHGINIGNTLEAMGGETRWGNPLITKAYIDLLKQSGFNAVRLPCSWDQYADASTARIRTDWLDRVEQVIRYCIDNDMYVLLNIHWDGGWLESNCTAEKQAITNAKQKAFWEQIATRMRHFDEHLLFASANEPAVKDAAQQEILLTYHQTFIDAVRSTGGKNAYRVLVVQGPMTDIETTNKLMTRLPADEVPDRLMVEVHYYTPWNFTGMTKDEAWGNQFFYWGKGNHSATDLAHNPTYGEESTVDAAFRSMKTQFIDKGIPVLLGEYGCQLRTNLTGDAFRLHQASRIYYIGYVTRQARANGLLPFFWDTGSSGAIFDRHSNRIEDSSALDALLK
ncbi:glycoside hydrolase family 5 protein [Spirosoma sordidisoli]|nr:glycoside hydrolase family 5 protein [Spirosoma sordidisoli]